MSTGLFRPVQEERTPPTTTRKSPIYTGAPRGMASYLTAEISASAVRHNVAQLRGLLGPAQGLCAVVKANCYGHGTKQLAALLGQLSNCLAVATAEEAMSVRAEGYRGPLLALLSACAYCDSADPGRGALADLIAQEVTVTLGGQAELHTVASAARRLDTRAKVHVKVDTGMGRGGLLPPAAPSLLASIAAEERVELTGIYTHLATADEADKSGAIDQLARFDETIATCGGCEKITVHAANSAAAIDLPQSRLDMIRPGIALYGYRCSDEMHNHLPLRAALRLTGRLIQIKTVPAGSSCGYGLTHTFTEPTRLGLVPIGYADGYLRSLSNRAVMRIGGTDAPIRGRVSMDQVIVDLTGLPTAKVGDEVEVISADPSAPNSVENLARLAGTVPYEIICRLGNRVHNVLVD